MTFTLLRVLLVVALLIACALIVSGCAARTSSVSTLPSDVRAGAEVWVVWDCLPLWVPQIVGQMADTPGQLGPCYGERLKILTVLQDGWVEAADATDGSVWLVNLRRAMAVQSVQGRVRAD